MVGNGIANNEGSNDDVDDVSDPGYSPVSAAGTSGQLLFHRQEWSGPIPPPSMLAEYKAVDPEFPKIIMEAFTQQSAHRQQMEQQLLTGSERRANRGQWIGTVIVALGIGAGVVAILAGQAAAGATIVTVVFAGGIASYLFGDYSPSGKGKHKG